MIVPDDHPPFHRSLLDPHNYPYPSQTVSYTETHISRLYLTENRVYKIKKPIDFGFLNFTTLEKRLHFCREEVRLNRRFAPGIYDAVVPIRQYGDRFFIGGEQGVTVEYAVVMKRLPRERLLYDLLQQSDCDLSAEMERLGGELARLHCESEICRKEEPSSFSVVCNNWQENFAQIEPLTGGTISKEAFGLCRNWVDRSLERLASIINERESQGWVRDGHGDLHAEHICLTDPICIYDCIEFNRRFRVADILSDVAFLLMDLDRRGRRDLAAQVLSVWTAGTGSTDQNDLLRFYKVYRAFVRGKVDTFLVNEADAAEETRQEAMQAAREYFNLALGYLSPPSLILTCGLMGVGKTVLARTLARSLGAIHLRSDVIRKELAGYAGHSSDPFGHGLYSPDSTLRTYDRMMLLAEKEIAAGRSVIVDASFIDPTERERFRYLAESHGIPCLLLDLHCPQELIRQRLSERSTRGDDPSDGRIALLTEQATRFVPPVLTENPLTIDTSCTPEENVQLILCTLMQRYGTVN